MVAAGFGQEGRTAARDGDARGGPGRMVGDARAERAASLSRFMDREISKGNLRLALTQTEDNGAGSTSAITSTPRGSGSGGPSSSATA